MTAQEFALTIDDVQRLALPGWPGLEQERLGEWVLRAGGGFTGRANSALPLGDADRPLADAVDAVEAFYQARGLPPKMQIPFPLSGPDDPASGRYAALDALLADRGWPCDRPTLVMLAALAPPDPAADPLALSGAADEVQFVCDSAPDTGWYGLYHYRGGPLPDVGRQVLTASPALFVSARTPAGEVVAIARAARSGAWIGLTAVEVTPRLRRRGLGRALTRYAMQRGREDGARSAYLQVDSANTGALALYRELGFVEHHRYHYRTSH